MITERYDYKSLKRKNLNGKRHYLLEGTDYTPMASVTTILEATKAAEDKAGLDRWRKAVGYKKAQEITHEAASRGTRMHKYLEDYIKQANKMARIIVDKGLKNVDEYWGVEVPVCHPNIYAGTTDCVGIHKGDEAIVDFKQTNKPKKEEWIADYYQQLTAYGEAHNALYGSNIRKGVIMMCSKDFEYQEFVINLDDFDEHRKKWWKRVEEYFAMQTS